MRKRVVVRPPGFEPGLPEEEGWPLFLRRLGRPVS